MVRVDFNRSLCELEADLHRLGRLVEQAVIKAMDALKSQDLQASSEVVMANDLIDEMRFQLEEQCIDLMATQQPLAVDLRTLVAVLHLAVELERIGDYAEGIGKIGLTLGENAPLTIPENIFLMADKATDMLRRSLRALADREIDAANQVRRDDKAVDSLYHQVCRDLFADMGRERANIKRSTHLLWVAHDLERIADRATNIAEQVVFLVTGDLVRASGAGGLSVALRPG
jgi:phosphate transport system protein